MFMKVTRLCVDFALISGEFGVVYKAHLQWQMDAVTEVVAVKTLKGIPLGHIFTYSSIICSALP